MEVPKLPAVRGGVNVLSLLGYPKDSPQGVRVSGCVLAGDVLGLLTVSAPEQLKVDLSLQSSHLGVLRDSGPSSRTAVGVLSFSKEMGEVFVVGTWSLSGGDLGTPRVSLRVTRTFIY